MSSPITFSGFNKIDFNVILQAVMQQESQPLTMLQSQQSDLQSQQSAYGTLATQLSSLQTAIEALSDANTLTGHVASSSNPSLVSATGSSSALDGTYDVVVNELARAQVTASTSTVPDTNTTIVASGGSLTIGGVEVDVTGPATLSQLAGAINQTANIGVTASIVQSDANAYQLVLTSNTTGKAGAFTVSNNLTGGTGISFGGNAVDATDASLLVNNIPITSSTNQISTAIPGVTLSLLSKDPTSTTIVTVADDNSDLTSRINTFVTAYNALLQFLSSQVPSASQSQTGVIGGDALVRGLKNALTSAVSAQYQTGGAYSYLAQVGIGFDSTGKLTVDSTLLDSALTSGSQDIAKLFTDAGPNPGAFASLDALVKEYTDPAGFVPGVQQQLTQEVQRMGDQITHMQDLLNIRKATLQQEYLAADQILASLNSQSAALGSFGSSLNTFF